MIRHRDVEQLQQLSQAPGKTLTVYLDVDQTNAANRKRQFETHLRDLLKQLRAAHPDDEELTQTCSEVEEIAKRIEPTGKTLVLARHRRLGVTFRKVIRIALPSFAYWSNGAFLRPLIEALDEHERFGIFLVDQKRARLFTVFLGDIEEHKDLISQIPPRPDAPSADKLRSQSKMERHHDESVSTHVRLVAGEISRLMEHLEVDRLILGGNVGVASELARALPKRLRGRLIEVLPIPLTASTEDILARASDVQTRLERAEELEVVRELLKEVRKGGERSRACRPRSRRSTRGGCGSSSTSRASRWRAARATTATCFSTRSTSAVRCAETRSRRSSTWSTGWRGPSSSAAGTSRWWTVPPPRRSARSPRSPR